MSEDKIAMILDSMIIVLSLILLWLGVDILAIILSLLSITYFNVIYLKWELKE